MPPIPVDVVLLVLLLAVFWLVLRSFQGNDNRDLMTRLDTRLEDQDKRLDKLEQHLGMTLRQQHHDSAELRETLLEKFTQMQQIISDNLSNNRAQTLLAVSEMQQDLNQALGEHRASFEQRQAEAIRTLDESLQRGMTHTQKQVTQSLNSSAGELGKRVENLTAATDQRLQEISGQVEKRLTEGFEKTTATFADVLKRLTVIDEAQKKISELTSNVVSLQEVLSDKRSRGAFGEVQLAALVRNVMPEQSFSLQHTLPNDTRADCLLMLPEPTGNVAIDAKFPLESYKRMMDNELAESDRKLAERQFKKDVQKHVRDVAEKYIIPGTTSDGAILFIPAEAVFAEIQAHHTDVVQFANNARVWLVSPTTLWAILNTARAVLKDAATREQVHIIQEHLVYLSRDFDRFRKRMDNLGRHVAMAHKDVQEVHTSAERISSRFEKIEKVELDHINTPGLDVDQNE